MSVIWEDPPAKAFGNGGRTSETWDTIVSECQQNPGRWARHPKTYKGRNASQIWRQVVMARNLVASQWEFAGRQVATGSNTCHVWVRYIGGES